MLGDPAYPLLQSLMKAFPDKSHLSRQDKNFNYRLSRARVVVEHSYGCLKGRWRCLLKQLDVTTCDEPCRVMLLMTSGWMEQEDERGRVSQLQPQHIQKKML